MGLSVFGGMGGKQGASISLDEAGLEIDTQEGRLDLAEISKNDFISYK